VGDAWASKLTTTTDNDDDEDAKLTNNDVDGIKVDDDD